MVKKIKQKPTEKKEILKDNNSYTAKDIYVLEGLQSSSEKTRNVYWLYWS